MCGATRQTEPYPSKLSKLYLREMSYADMKGLMETTDEWLRHRIRAVYWKQWKRVRTRYKIFRALHLPEWQVHKMANCRKGTWRAAKMLNSVLTKTIIVDRLGYPSMTAHYLNSPIRFNFLAHLFVRSHTSGYGSAAYPGLSFEVARFQSKDEGGAG